MVDYVELACTPFDEPCVQVSRDKDYYQAMKQECAVFKRMLERLHPEMPDGCYFTVKSHPHDFGTYCEVCVAYNDDDEEAADFAWSMEGDLPEHWDDQAREELEKIVDYRSLIH